MSKLEVKDGEAKVENKVIRNFIRGLAAFNTPLINDGYQYVDGLSVFSTLKNKFGARLYRDAADLRIIGQIEADNAPSWATAPSDEDTFGTAFSTLPSMSSTPSDSDSDGMFDQLEVIAFGGIDVTDDPEGDYLGSGYTNVEYTWAVITGDLITKGAKKTESAIMIMN